MGHKIGDISQLNKIKTFSNISTITNNFYKGAQYVRAYGCSIQILRLLDNICLIKLPSSEIKFFSSIQKILHGTITKVFNINNNNKFKAGKLRNLGYKSIVRKCAMNPVDHPHGGNTSSKAIGLTYYGRFYKNQKIKNVRSSYLNFLFSKKLKKKNNA